MRFILASKWIAAAAPAFSLTLPFTTCHSYDGKTNQHYLPTSWQSIEAWCFFWPLPILIARSGWKRLRAALPFPIADFLLALAALIVLTLRVFGAALISLGGIQPGPGFALAGSSLIAYGGLSIADLVVIIRGRQRDGAHIQGALVAE